MMISRFRVKTPSEVYMFGRLVYEENQGFGRPIRRIIAVIVPT